MKLYIFLRTTLASVLFLLCNAMILSATGVYVKSVYCELAHFGEVFIPAERAYALAVMVLLVGSGVIFCVHGMRADGVLKKFRDCDRGDRVILVVELAQFFFLPLCNLIECVSESTSVLLDILSSLFCILLHIGFCCVFLSLNTVWQMKCRYLRRFRLPDEQLFEIALCSTETENVREAAAGRIKDPRILCKLALCRSGACRRVRQVCLERADAPTLFDAALDDTYAPNRIFAVNRLSDVGLLTQLLRQERVDRNVFAAACARLKEIGISDYGDLQSLIFATEEKLNVFGSETYIHSGTVARLNMLYEAFGRDRNVQFSHFRILRRTKDGVCSVAYSDDEPQQTALADESAGTDGQAGEAAPEGDGGGRQNGEM